jgi:metal-responsive CopG/Arc/MetJ family transcriptional regulator
MSKALLAVQVPVEVVAAVDKLAAANYTSRSEIVRQAVIRDLARTGFAPAPQPEREVA